MIARVVDNLLGMFSPRWQLSRMVARNTIKRMKYLDGAKPSKTSPDHPRNISADMIGLDASITRARARELYTNNAVAQGAVRAWVRNVVGQGFTPQSQAGVFNAELKEYSNAIEREWNEWQVKCDYTQQMTFAEVLRLCVIELIVAGEFLLRDFSDASKSIPYSLEMIDVDRFDETITTTRTSTQSSENEIRRGVEVDRGGKPVAYHIFDRHPSEVNYASREVTPIPAREVVHFFLHARVGQTRGISAFNPVIHWLRNLWEYVDAEIIASRLASCFGVAVKTLDGGQSGGFGMTDDSTACEASCDRSKFTSISPGQVANLLPGEEIEVINPQRNGVSTDVWVSLIMRVISAGLGLSYERLSRDYSKTNYSSNRASDLEDRREFRLFQNLLKQKVCDRVWRGFVEACIKSKRPGMPSAEEYIRNRSVYDSVSWTAPAWEWVDPLKEVKSVVAEIESGINSREQVIRDRGRDPEKITAEIQNDPLRAELIQAEKEQTIFIDQGV